VADHDGVEDGHERPQANRRVGVSFVRNGAVAGPDSVRYDRPAPQVGQMELRGDQPVGNR